jgi:hypothetical protein
MKRLFHLFAIIIFFISFILYANISYQQVINSNEIKPDIKISEQEKNKKIEEENLKINQAKDIAVRNASIALILIIIVISAIFYYYGRKKKCPSCKKIFAGTVIDCVPIEKNNNLRINTKTKYSIKKKCIYCGYEWSLIDNKAREIKVYEDESLI